MNPPMKNVNKIKGIFKICFALINEKDAIIELTTLIEETPEDLRPEKRVNHIGKK